MSYTLHLGDALTVLRTLDAGSGTTLAVAAKFGRRAIGIDLDPRNAALVHTRIEQSQPMLLEATP